MNKEKIMWKVLVIVFMSLFVVETILFIGSYVIGTDIVAEDHQDDVNANECAWDICQGSETYYYDDSINRCTCYLDGQLVHSEYMDYIYMEI